MRCFLLALACVLPALAADAPRPLYRIEAVAGSDNLGDGGPALSAQFGNIQGIALDRWGNLYIADTDRHRVRKVAPGGGVSTIAGTGAAGFSGDGGAAVNAQLNLPYGIAVDLAGAVYIADLGNNRVRRVAPDGSIATLAGNGRKASGADSGLAVETPLLTPRNVATDASGAVYISEFEGHRVRRVTPDGRIATVAGTGVAGFRGDGGAAATAQLGFPAGLAVDRSGAVLVADSQNNRIRRIVPGGTITTALGGAASATALSTPLAIAVDLAGTIFVVDSTNVARSFSSAGVWADVAGVGSPGFSGDGGPATAAQLTAARDLAIDVAGNLYIADGMRVRRVDWRGTIQTVAGDGYVRAVGDGSAAGSALLLQPLAVTLDYAGNLYIADSGTERVRQVTPAGTMRTLAGTGLAGAGLDTAAILSPLNSPMGVALAPDGSIAIADTYNHRIRVVTADGSIRTVAGDGKGGIGPEAQPPLLTQLRGPRSICFDRAGTLYIVDTSNHRVLRAPVGGVVQTAAGNGSPGDAGDGGVARLAQLNQPSACAVDTSGNLFIADTLSHRIRKVTPGGTISTVAGTGNASFSGDDASATTAALNAPRGVAVDDAGDIFIADTANHRIRQVTPDGAIHTIAGAGPAGLAGDGGAAETALLNAPAGLVLDGAGDLYFADSGNNRVRRLVPARVLAPPPFVLPPPLTALNAASMRPGPVAPGEMLVIYGEGLGPENGVEGAAGPSGVLANLAGGVEVRFDGIPAPIFYAQAAQVNVQAPYTLAGAATTHAEVFYRGVSAGTLDLAVVQANPAVFPVVVNQDGSMNTDSSPAPRGTLVTLFATGEGLSDGANISGMPAQPPYPRPALPVAVRIAGIQADLVYAGAAPALIGELQINARVPVVPPGPVSVELAVGPFAAPAITIWVN
jgi:uncharacterized protein (TIGR03437 family)